MLPGTDDATLNRAVGHIEGTALPSTDGNSAIAGHRDGFFRGLKDIADGDAIEIETVQRKDVYRVERVWIVSAGRRVGTRRNTHTLAHAGHMLSVLLRRLGAEAVHRPCCRASRP